MKFTDYLKLNPKKSTAYSSGLSRGICLILIFAALLSFSSCGTSTKAPLKKTYYEFFDTVCSVSYYGTKGEEYFEETAEFIESELERYHRLFDAYHSYAGINNLYTVNSSAGISAVCADSALIELISYGKEFYSLTGGEVNIALGAVTSLWKEAQAKADTAPKEAVLPSDALLREAAKHISIDSIIIDKKASTVYITDSLTSIDVGAIGKGVAAEYIAKSLRARGDEGFVLDLGGNIRAVGSKPDGSGWITGIENPDVNSDEPFIARVEVLDSSCVTSGDYRRYFTIGGKKYHHIIDGDTLYPAEYFSSVTVIAADSGLADALSTALFCMPLADGQRLIESIDGVQAIWVEKDGNVVRS